MLRCQAGRHGEAGWPGFIQICPFFACGLLQAQLIQNLWNLLEIIKICMGHGAKAHIIPEKLTVRTGNNGHQHSLWRLPVQLPFCAHVRAALAQVRE